ncbi:hypothetical protein ABW21_db0205812 [Orbilia brochopaga]|nr:hypothetical protein ABW21_db0205812 [Drechslerella brochopaga]
MRERDVSVAKAKEIIIKEVYRGIEDEYLELQQQFYQEESNATKSETARYFSSLHLLIAGNAVWHINNPRYQMSPDNPFYPKPEHKLADLRMEDAPSGTNNRMRYIPVDGVKTNGVTNSDSLNDTLPDVLEPFEYIASLPSKRVRKMATAALNIWYRVPQRSLEIIDSVIDMLHSSSLM